MPARRPLSDEEVQKFIKHGFTGKHKIRNRAMFCFGIATGYRIQEICNHKVRDVVERKYIKDYVELPKRLRKGKAEGQVKELFGFNKLALQHHVDLLFEESGKETYGDIFDDWLFPSEKVDRRTGQPRAINAKSMNEIFSQAFYECNISGAVGTHSMRKTFAMKVYEQAVKDFREGTSTIDPVRVVMRHLGHKNIDSTLKYLSFLTSKLDKSKFDFEL